jgi:hypothetical protein
VSSVKFAAITATLLARKGDAAPSIFAPVTAPPRPTLVPRQSRPTAPPRQPDNGEKPRRIMVAMTPEELERLAIAAIKLGFNRHDIVRSALDDYFRKMAAELPHACRCMEGPAIAARHAETRPAHPSYPVSVDDPDFGNATDEDHRDRVSCQPM